MNMTTRYSHDDGKSLYKKLILLAVPLALQNIISFAVSLADNIMVGRLGEIAISGVYLCNQIQVFLQMLVAGIGAALIVLASQYWGKGDSASVKSIVGISMKLALVFALVFWGLLFFYPESLLRLFTDDASAINEAMKYAGIICFSYVFFCITNVLTAAMRCVGTVSIGMYLSIMTFIVNVSLNWVLIFGKLGMPALGIKGAAIATLISRILECFVIVIYVARIDKKLFIRLSDLIRSSSVLLWDFVRYGMPVILGDILWGINLSVQGAIVGRLGAETIAAVSIANTVFSVVSIGVYGTASASAIIIGNTVGEGDFNKVRAYTRKLQFVFLIIGACTGLLLFLIKDYVIFFYNVAPATRQLARSLMIVLSVTVVGTSYQMSCLTGIVRAGGATHFVLVNDSIFVWLVVIPLSYITAFVVGAPAWVVFLCLKSDQILKCAVAVVKVNRFNWIKQITKEFVPAKT